MRIRTAGAAVRIYETVYPGMPLPCTTRQRVAAALADARAGRGEAARPLRLRPAGRLEGKGADGRRYQAIERQDAVGRTAVELSVSDPAAEAGEEGASSRPLGAAADPIRTVEEAARLATEYEMAATERAGGDARTAIVRRCPSLKSEIWIPLRSRRTRDRRKDDRRGASDVVAHGLQGETDDEESQAEPRPEPVAVPPRLTVLTLLGGRPTQQQPIAPVRMHDIARQPEPEQQDHARDVERQAERVDDIWIHIRTPIPQGADPHSSLNSNRSHVNARPHAYARMLNAYGIERACQISAEMSRISIPFPRTWITYLDHVRGNGRVHVRVN